MGGPALIDGKDHHECDNFLHSEFVVDGVSFISAEQYFQYHKGTTDDDRASVLKTTGGMGAWTAGSRVTIRPDWEKVKVQVMYDGNLARFRQNRDLIVPLIATRGKIVFDASSSFWCHWNGLIMMRLRAEFRQGPGDAEEAARIAALMDAYAETA